jgi:thiol:disulfide interchange protein DsbD
MRKLFGTCLLVLLLGYAQAQSNPVQWQYSAKKIDAGTWEVHLTATLQEGWHIYAQQQPADAIATPTKFSFAKNPLVAVNGPVKEVGQVEKFKDPTLGIEQLQYAKKVDFIQKVKLKGSVKTNITGSATFQVCTDEKCLPPATTNFSIALEGE